MTEDEVREIAEQFVVDRSLDECTIVSIRRFCKSGIDDPSSMGDEWVVQFQFETSDDASASYALVTIDDATKTPELFETL